MTEWRFGLYFQVLSNLILSLWLYSRGCIMKWKSSLKIWSVDIQLVPLSLSLTKHTFRGKFGVHQSTVSFPIAFPVVVDAWADAVVFCSGRHRQRWDSQDVSFQKWPTQRMLVECYRTVKTTLWQDRAVTGMILISFNVLMGVWH